MKYVLYYNINYDEILNREISDERAEQLLEHPPLYIEINDKPNPKYRLQLSDNSVVQPLG